MSGNWKYRCVYQLLDNQWHWEVYFALTDARPDLLCEASDMRASVDIARRPVAKHHVTATASQTQSACRQCGSFTWRIEKRRLVSRISYSKNYKVGLLNPSVTFIHPPVSTASSHYVNLFLLLNHSLQYPHCSADPRKSAILHIPADKARTGSADWLTGLDWIDWLREKELVYFPFLFEGFFWLNWIIVVGKKNQNWEEKKTKHQWHIRLFTKSAIGISKGNCNRCAPGWKRSFGKLWLEWRYSETVCSNVDVQTGLSRHITHPCLLHFTSERAPLSLFTWGDMWLTWC